MGLSNIVRSRGFRNFMAKVYGWGASVVILGALFKINHYPGADIMLIVGLGTESLIFFFSAFEPPYVEPDWSLVYPELAGMYHIHGEGFKKPTEELDSMLDLIQLILGMVMIWELLVSQHMPIIVHLINIIFKLVEILEVQLKH